jgi:hypothetical protein
VGIEFRGPGFELLLAADLLLDLFGVKAKVVEGIAELPRGKPVEGFLELFEVLAAVPYRL